ncbi:hypothetical protein OGAPHI_006230 [Ogataea philodendri]|uniref:Uncharacterized protein n=1 Tax=Ogataea philodendri TaxID=1378263 RepID=A0A9P8NYZ1_9ASCO|nr:uncharacterized protein OGAPHI_006230 [Ogataea philodendri]KAH3662049.1 hypothetical protein OGAPHI_006230 [Ogataea philodendri]
MLSRMFSAHDVMNLKHSWQQAAATTAFVAAMAGMMFFTTPSVLDLVTPSMPNWVARALASWYIFSTWSGISALKSESGRQGAQRVRCLDRNEFHVALETRRDGGDHQLDRSLETFGSTIDPGNQLARGGRESDQFLVHPPPSPNAIEATHNHRELRVEGVVEVLDFAEMRHNCQFLAGNTFGNKLARHNGLRLTHIAWSEQKLPVQIANLNGVHVNTLYMAKPRKSQVLEDLAP